MKACCHLVLYNYNMHYFPWAGLICIRTYVSCSGTLKVSTFSTSMITVLSYNTHIVELVLI